MTLGPTKWINNTTGSQLNTKQEIRQVLDTESMIQVHAQVAVHYPPGCKLQEDSQQPRRNAAFNTNNIHCEIKLTNNNIFDDHTVEGVIFPVQIDPILSAMLYGSDNLVGRPCLLLCDGLGKVRQSGRIRLLEGVNNYTTEFAENEFSNETGLTFENNDILGLIMSVFA